MSVPIFPPSVRELEDMKAFSEALIQSRIMPPDADDSVVDRPEVAARHFAARRTSDGELETWVMLALGELRRPVDFDEFTRRAFAGGDRGWVLHHGMPPYLMEAIDQSEVVGVGEFAHVLMSLEYHGRSARSNRWWRVILVGESRA